jgi:hypothetical protein
MLLSWSGSTDIFPRPRLSASAVVRICCLPFDDIIGRQFPRGYGAFVLHDHGQVQHGQMLRQKRFPVKVARAGSARDQALGRCARYS